MLIDTHCHFDYLQEKGLNINHIVKQAHQVGVTSFVSISTNIKNFPNILQISKNNQSIWCSIGVHPLTIDSEKEPVPTEQLLLHYITHDAKIIALGETGLDYSRNPKNKIKQQENLLTHINVAQKTGLPIIIHTRNADQDTIHLINETYKKKAYSGIIHCFTASYDLAKKMIDIGFMISISGIITFKSAESLRQTIKKIPLDHLIIETDSPYLAPVPYRGHINEPKYIIHTANCLALLKKIEYEKLIINIKKNSKNIFLKMR